MHGVVIAPSLALALGAPYRGRVWAWIFGSQVEAVDSGHHLGG
jgi:hypothetical protein